jgi:hypothetical protein
MRPSSTSAPTWQNGPIRAEAAIEAPGSITAVE